jgi:hypothetical protein
MFLSIMKLKDKEPEQKAPNKKYTKLLDKVINTIENWQKKKTKMDFIYDDDFVERQGSPNKFDGHSDFSRSFDRYETFEENALSNQKGLSRIES